MTLFKTTKKSKDIYLDGRLREKLESVKSIMNKEWDCVILIDGIEGSGKTTLAFIIAWFISGGKITINNICANSKEAKERLENLPDKSTLIIDEGSLMFGSRDTMRAEQRELVKILNVIRQKQMCLIIVAPSFFDLNKYISVDRSRFLLHTYTDQKLNRGRFCYFGTRRKRILYTIGKKNFNSYKKPRADFIGKFVKFNPPFYEEYLKVKKVSLMSALHTDEKRISKQTLMKECWMKVVDNMNKVVPELSKEQEAQLLSVSKRTIQQYAKESRENEAVKDI